MSEVYGNRGLSLKTVHDDPLLQRGLDSVGVEQSVNDQFFASDNKRGGECHEREREYRTRKHKVPPLSPSAYRVP